MSNATPTGWTSKRRGWFGIDLDGTLAIYDGWKGPEHIGEPVPAMVAQVKALLANGEDVKIFTARVAATNDRNAEGVLDDKAFADQQVALIKAWCKRHVGQELEVTAVKDMNMIAFFDDRAVQVIKNTGVPIAEDALAALAVAEALYASLEGCTLTKRAKAIANELHKALGLPDTLKLEFNEKKIITR